MKIKSTLKAGKTKRQKPKYWVVAVTTVGIFVAYSVGSSRALAITYRDKASVVRSDKREDKRDDKRGENETRAFNISAGTLADAIKAFEKTTGWRVIVPDSEIGKIASPGVFGVFTDEDALRQLLKNTSVVYTFTELKTVTLKIQDVNATVEIVDEARTVSTPKYTEPLRDTPQTINVITSDVIEQQNATTLRDVLRNVPGLTVTAGEGGNVGGDNINLRGFSARNDIFVDGARDLSPQSRDPFNLEQVEVVKGPSSSNTGRGSTGGTVNLVSKTPSLKPIYNFDLTAGSDKTKRITSDINLPLARLGLGEQTAFRLNFMAHDSTVAGREAIENDRWGIAPTLSFAAGKKSFFTLGFLHQGQDNVTDYGIPWVPANSNALFAFRDRPAPVARDTFYGFKSRDNEILKTNLATIAFNHTFDDNMSLRNQFRYGHSTRDSIATPPRFTANPNSSQITREMRAWDTIDDTYDNQTDFTARFNTFGFEHALVTGTEFTRENNVRRTKTAPNAVPTVDLYNPNPNDVYTGVFAFNPLPGDVTATTQSVYLIDTIKLHPKFDINGSLRYDRYHAKGLVAPTTATGNPATPTNFPTPIDNLDNLLNYRFAVVYKPIEIGSIYATYGTAVNPSISGLIYDNATDVRLDPEKTNTLEAGTKWGFFDSRLLLTGAIFRIEKTNARTPGLTPDTQQVLDGRQRVDGIELGVTGNITRDWSILTGYTLLDSRIVESNANLAVVRNPLSSLEIGKRLINTPRNSFNLWSTYQLPFKLNVGGGARFVDRRYGNTINTRFVDSYWLIEATASYQVTKNIEVRLNGYNLGNKYYFDRITGGQVVPGAGRSLLVSTGFRF